MVRAPRLSHVLLLGILGRCLIIASVIAIANPIMPPGATPRLRKSVAAVSVRDPEPAPPPAPQAQPDPEPDLRSLQLRNAFERHLRQAAKEPDEEMDVEPPSTRIAPRRSIASVLPTPLDDEDPVYVGDDLAKVPLLKLEAPPDDEIARVGTLTTAQWTKRKARQIVLARELNQKKEDGFLEALVSQRPDLSGLPFQMGAACRTQVDRARAFAGIAAKTRQREELPRPEGSAEQRRQYRLAHVAFLAQVMGEEEKDALLKRVRTLSSIDEPEATREIARAAIFSPDRSVRDEAIRLLADRPSKDSTEVLVAGLRYPWPAVAGNAARAIVELKRNDLIGQLKATVAREVVRINHHRSCLLCHPPADSATPEGVLLADVPVPSEPLNSGSAYGTPPRRGGLLVRIDVTYLRQDFSVVQRVYDSSVWRVDQRFDFFVRQRLLTASESVDLRKRLGKTNPYHRAAAAALRELTGRDS